MSIDQIQYLLIEISANDCQRSFKKFFDTYYPRLFEIAKYYLKANHFAEEVVADVFIKIWRTRKSLNKIDNIQSYLFIAIKRQSLNFLRSKKTDFFYIDSLEHETMVESKNPEQELFTQEYLEYFSKCIQNFPTKTKLIFKLVKEDGMKYKEVADVLNLSIKTIEMHMTTALKQLKTDMQKYTNYHTKLPTSKSSK